MSWSDLLRNIVKTFLGSTVFLNFAKNKNFDVTVHLNNDFQRLKPSLKISNSDSGRRTEFLIGGYHTILRQV